MRMLRNEPLQGYNTLSLEGRANALVRVCTKTELLAALQWAAERDLTVIPLGEGSNVVIAADLDAMVVRTDMQGIEIIEDRGDAVVVRVAAGENWHGFVQWSLEQGYYGLENLALIPGTVGAAPVQNIGAYGVELASFVQMVHCLPLNGGDPLSLPGVGCEFGYRDSIFKQALQDQFVITAVDLQLSRLARVETSYPALANALQTRGIETPTPRSVFDTVVDIRRSKLPDPSRVPNAGSFFKNPVVTEERARALIGDFPALPAYPQSDSRIKLPAAWLIDYCGWKGVRRNGLGIHPDHALVIVNYGNNSGAALLSLAEEVAASVLETFGLRLEIEPRVYGASA